MGIITEATHTIAVTVPYGTNRNGLVPTIAISTGASISPLTGVGQNFTGDVTYTVTAEDATTQDYTVTVMVSNDYTSAHIGTLKYVPAGSFQRDGTSTNISTVTTAFHMSQYEIQQSQYFAVTGGTPSRFTGGTLPVEQVTWFDAVEFCNDLSTLEGFTPVYTITDRDPLLTDVPNHPITSATVIATWTNNGYRLPTEMEWEWAAMGATSDRSNSYTGTGINTTGYTKGYAGSTEIGGAQIYIGNYAWTQENSPTTTQPVGTAGTTGHPNELGLYDMSGNVWEWCWDKWDGTTDYTPTGALDNDTYRVSTSGDYRVLRGGGWGSYKSYATVAYRYNDYPYLSSGGNGFRVVRP